MPLKFPKNDIIRDKAWLRKVAKLPCICCGHWSDTVVGHHILRAPGKGMATKAGDNYVLPLCFSHHQLAHQNEKELFESHGIYNAPDTASQLYGLKNQPEQALQFILRLK